MIELIIGGSASGKSAYAEDEICHLQTDNRIYAATMMRGSKEADERIARHKALRAGKGFTTVEVPVDLLDQKWDKNAAVLLEDLPNLAANEYFRADRVRKNVSELIEELHIFANRVRHLVIVSGNVFADGLEYDEMTQEYLRYLGALHHAMAQMADKTVEVVYGIGIEE